MTKTDALIKFNYSLSAMRVRARQGFYDNNIAKQRDSYKALALELGATESDLRTAENYSPIDYRKRISA